MRTPIVVGRIGNEPIFSLPMFPTFNNSGQPTCACATEPVSLSDLLEDASGLADEFGEVANELHAAIQQIDNGMRPEGEYALRVQTERERLLRQLVVANQAVIQLKALVGTAGHVLR